VGVCADVDLAGGCEGTCLHLSDCVERGRKVDERARLLCEYLGTRRRGKCASRWRSMSMR